ncbi:hydrogenase nickel insertion protein HypA [Candidatus Methanoperedens nitroreducens]|uniref:Hydrogenase maturation factor HypA n=1 Tax=Candidatus Methanoperedens nitratireducens TaxID=1392998 RepID=A0A062VDZ4_9EURY|nr:hydrogenase maturation nickel metallochaperone HypA [Candidatus Methanoperedens nitroreducens]KCZ73410.1 hydrogenase nickel insertion protein HypA [Candidatus Methanoperedens nitroreducens]MDJ1422635.1 hydrogenase maturation nickel metallochaperone HypA [Candidatus Methanoperedens sp.]
MHEVSIAGAIIDAVLDAAKKNNAEKVSEVFIEVGELTALYPDQLRFIFETITAGTVAEGAKYDIKVIKPMIKCKCSYNGPVESFEKLHFFMPTIKCPKCGETDVEITAGRECCVKRIKIS